MYVQCGFRMKRNEEIRGDHWYLVAVVEASPPVVILFLHFTAIPLLPLEYYLTCYCNHSFVVAPVVRLDRMQSG